MSPDPVLELLAKQSATSLRAMQDEIRLQIESLRVQYELLTRAVAAKQPSATGAQVPRGAKRAIFREILSTRPDHPWMPSEVRTALAMQGIESSSSAIRVMLRRMAEDEEVERGAQGVGWKLTSSESPHRQEPSEATSWNTPGGMDGDSSPTPVDGPG